MGLFRKMTSVSTAGLVDFRSDKERIARSTRRTDKAVRAQNQLLRQQARAQLPWAPAAPPLPLPPPQPQLQGPPPGWYDDPEATVPDTVRWYDGAEWTEFTQPKFPPGAINT